MLNKILITLNKKEDIPQLKKLGINTYVYPLAGYCVGYPNTFLIAEIPEHSYILVNGIFTNAEISNFQKLMQDNLPKFKGLIFDDLGVLEIVKDYHLEKILYLSHFNTNRKSIQLYLDYVDSVFVSPDITKEEISSIVEYLPDKLTLFVLGYVGAMYSRRLLLTNYAQYHHLPYSDKLKITNTGHDFLVLENNSGTYFYHTPVFNGLELLKLPAKYYFINMSFLTVKDIQALLSNSSTIPTDQGFLYQETIFKLRGDNHD